MLAAQMWVNPNYPDFLCRSSLLCVMSVFNMENSELGCINNDLETEQGHHHRERVNNVDS